MQHYEKYTVKMSFNQSSYVLVSARSDVIYRVSAAGSGSYFRTWSGQAAGHVTRDALRRGNHVTQGTHNHTEEWASGCMQETHEWWRAQWSRTLHSWRGQLFMLFVFPILLINSLSSTSRTTAAIARHWRLIKLSKVSVVHGRNVQKAHHIKMKTKTERYFQNCNDISLRWASRQKLKEIGHKFVEILSALVRMRQLQHGSF